jgi:hypothetical protein
VPTLLQRNAFQDGLAQVDSAKIDTLEVGTLQISLRKETDRGLTCDIPREFRFVQESYYVPVPFRIQSLYHRRRARLRQRAHLTVSFGGAQIFL